MSGAEAIFVAISTLIESGAVYNDGPKSDKTLISAQLLQLLIVM
jgi:hypothetical protein